MKSPLNMYTDQERLLRSEDEPKYPIRGGRDHGAQPDTRLTLERLDKITRLLRQSTGKFWLSSEEAQKAFAALKKVTGGELSKRKKSDLRSART